MPQRVARGIAAAAFVLAAGGLGVATAPPAAARQGPLTADSLAMSIRSVTPSTPPASDEPADVTVVLELTNTTDQKLARVDVQGVRGTPIDNQADLDAAIAQPKPPDESLAAPVRTKDGKPVTAALDPRATAQVTFVTTAEIPVEAGICLCHNAIYPLYFTAHSTDLSGADVLVGAAQTYVPSFKDPQDVAPVQVSWVWPILDRPHRQVDGGAFTDDDLAASISAGRLSRVLDVVSGVAGKTPLTLVTDPELIDEIAVMAAGPYQVGTGGKVRAGAGTDAARAWLERLRAALGQPSIQLSMTPFADPDVDSLTRNGLTWSSALNRQAQLRVAQAVGRASTDDELAWPVGEAAGEATLDALVRRGAQAAILSDRTLPLRRSSPQPNGLATVQTSAGPLTALVTSAAVQRVVGPVVSLGGPGTAQLPELVAQIALRAVNATDTASYLPVVAPRLVNPSVDVAVRAILDTTHVFWATGTTASAAVGAVAPAEHGPLTPATGDGTGLPAATIDAAREIATVLPALQTMMSAADAGRLLGAIPAAVQRAESSQWVLDRPAGDAFAAAIRNRLDALVGGVEIIRPTTGTYTLASSNSPLPVTVWNHLTVPVTVRVRVASANGLPGFSSKDTALQLIGPGVKLPLHIPTQVERAGRFDVEAVLVTPGGGTIGRPVTLSVRSTALGAIGVIITVTAGVVLVLALVIRALRRLRTRHRAVEQVRVPEPV